MDPKLVGPTKLLYLWKNRKHQTEQTQIVKVTGVEKFSFYSCLHEILDENVISSDSFKLL